MEKIKVSSVRKSSTFGDLFGEDPKIATTDHPPCVPTVPYTDSDGKTVDVPLSVFFRALESKIAAKRRAFRGADLAEYRDAMLTVAKSALAMALEQHNVIADWAAWDSENDATQEGEHGASATVAKSHPDHPDASRRS